MIRVGDIVKRFDQPGSGTGILYQVISIGNEKEHYCRTQLNRSIRKRTRKVKLRPVIVMFDGKWSKERNAIQHFIHDLEKIDIVGIATEWNKLQLFLQDEARHLGMHQPAPTSSPKNIPETKAEDNNHHGPQDCCGRCGRVVKDCGC